MSEPPPLTGRTVGRFVTDLERNLVLDRWSDAFGSAQLNREEFEHRTTGALDARTDLHLSLLTAGLRDAVRTAPVEASRRTVVDLSTTDLGAGSAALGAFIAGNRRRKL